MSTRGLVGVVVDDQIKATYNHSDSYPSWLGQRVLEFAGTLTDAVTSAAVLEQARAVRMIDDDDAEVSEADLAALAAKGVTPNTAVGAQADSPTWYQALRDVQGDLGRTLELGYMIDGASFAQDSLFCEYAYLVNLDTRMIEFYEGFQTSPGTGRFTPGNPVADRGYYPVSLVSATRFPTDAKKIARTVKFWSKITE